MKSVLISIQPKWVEKIASGEKTIEVRKSRPKIETPFKCYIYCTIGSGMKGDYLVPSNIQCGKVIGEFVCDRIEDFSKWEFDYPSLLRHINLYAGTNGNYEFLDKYLKSKKYGYGWHISNLVIYNKPKELSEFGQKCDMAYEIRCRDCLIRKGWNECCEVMCKPLTRPPQSWCYVEENEQ
jgi:predicted transcriptional regulator